MGKGIQANEFACVVKKLPKQQKLELYEAVKASMADPLLGEAKVADLAGVRVYKFKLNKQLALLGCEYDGEAVTLYLLKPGSHENFYRDLKNGP
ncbi:MAG: type II toxin-antitoxin system RelE/ParE family toxin [Pseudomonas sp.]|uniref:type II toxin-antitoxin system RelE/ParE family toxin n=1 Tax=Pseudomonas sp. TaxID=306 RepID=UPI0027323930|nr:type II toxin-antitoxin system RelE/ParE family toxin [Pseudomonas sp.]MDP3846816.1 type II toxin-antitoxin system RelE/ParE family toxin [Pseudomonas sp.]